jgi:hypothetical protein
MHFCDRFEWITVTQVVGQTWCDIINFCMILIMVHHIYSPLLYAIHPLLYKLLPYKSIITPIWTCGNQLWGCACKSNIAVIQRCESKIPRTFVDTPRYVANYMIHKALGIPTVHEVIHNRSVKHRTKLESHSNPLLQHLLRDDVIRRLTRRWSADL